MRAIHRADAFVGRHMASATLICVALGVLFPDTFSVMKSLTIWMFAFMTFANSLGGGFKELGKVALHPLPVLITLGILHVILPLAALGLGSLLLPGHPLFTTGLVLEYAVPTAVASLMWVGIGRGDGSLCLAIVLLDTLLSPVVVPLTLKLLVGSVVKMDTLGMMKNLVIMVAIPALVAMTLHQVTRGRVAKTVKPQLAPFAKLALLLIILTNATGCAPFLRHITPTLVLVMLSAFLLSVLAFFLSYQAGRLMRLSFPMTETVTLTGGMRNNCAGAVLAMRYFPGDVLFPAAFSPMFQQLTTAIVVRLLRRTKAGQADQAAFDRQAETELL